MNTACILAAAALVATTSGQPSVTATPTPTPIVRPTPDPDAALLFTYTMDNRLVAAVNGHCQVLPADGVDYATARLYVSAFVDLEKLCAARERLRAIWGGPKP